jgi:diguanylate cyclase (GGDEF)-like protein/PAS domain S-box-containing protein
MRPAGSEQTGRSRLRQVILLGFAAIFLLIGLTAAVQWREVGQFPQLIESGRIATEKMDLITSLIEVARSRTRMTSQMIATQDPFDKDALRMRLDEQAAYFAQLRERLVAIGLTEEERLLLEQNGEFVRPALQAQRRAAELAMSDDPEVLREAQRLLMFEAFPLQGRIVDNFMRIAQLQRDKVSEATLQAQSGYERMVYLLIGLTGGSLLLAMLVAVFVVRKTSLIEAALHREKERAQVTLRSIGDAVIATDAVGRVQYMNPAAEVLTGHTLAQVMKRPVGEVLNARDEGRRRSIGEHVLQLVQHGNPGAPSDDVLLVNKQGEELSIALTLARIREVDGRIGGVILSFQDVTESRQLAKRIEFHAQHDALTGLLNRRAFQERVKQALAIYDQGVHVLCAMDLDRFKLVNDSCGHAAGDELLRQLTGRLRAVVRKGDLIARMGGDEFAFFLLNTDLAHAAELAEKLLETVREYRFLWEGKTFRVGASIGLVQGPAGSVVDFQHLLRAADAACYQAKAEGRDRAVVVPYDGASLEAQRQEGEWVSRINEALENDGFALVGQPIVALDAGGGDGGFVEVLVRMGDAGGDIPPMSFLPAAERYNLMPKIDEWVVRQVLRLLEAERNGARSFAINLSGQSIGDAGFVQRVVDLIERSRVDRGRLCFELTETAAIASLDTAQHFMNVARGMGCQVALDDFGSGLSSFAYIKNLPVDLIKIDGEFIQQLADDKTSRVMVEAIHGVARALGLRTVAEFVGDAETLRILRSIGVDMAQGYYLGRPMPLTLSMPAAAGGAS